MIEIIKIAENKYDYLDLLLLADEQEEMIKTYIERGDMFVLMDEGVKAECVVTGPGVYESKTLPPPLPFKSRDTLGGLSIISTPIISIAKSYMSASEIARSPSHFTKAVAFTNPID